MATLAVVLILLLLIGLRLNKILQDEHDERPLPPAHTPEDPFRHHAHGCRCAWHR